MNNLIKNIFKEIFTYGLRYKSFQDWVNTNFNNVGGTPVPTSGIWVHEGIKYPLTEKIGINLFSISDTREYKFYELKPTDVVIDIGANVGGFSTMIHDKVEKVYCIEPIFGKYLESLFAYNNIGNIEVIKVGLGKGIHKLEYNGYIKENVSCLPLRTIIKMCGNKVDLIKMDCEGGEWNITETDLQYAKSVGLRTIVAEIHNTKNYKKEEFIELLNKNGFSCVKYNVGKTEMLITAQVL